MRREGQSHGHNLPETRPLQNETEGVKIGALASDIAKQDHSTCTDWLGTEIMDGPADDTCNVSRMIYKSSAI